MTFPRFCRVVHISLFALLPFPLFSTAHAQGAKKTAPGAPVADADADHVQQRSEWFLRGRVVPGRSSAELRYRAYQAKMQARAARLARTQAVHADSQPLSAGAWTPLGPVPLASDATGDGFQNYNQVSGRATAVAIDPADPTGNTVYIGGAQGGVWKSTNAAASTASNVTWTAVTDDQGTLSIGSIAIQPGNSDPAESVVLAGTGEADNSADSYFGLGILRSADGGNTWTLISTANSGTYSFSGLGATRMAFSTASGQTGTVVAAMAATSEGVTVGALTGNTYRGLYTSTDGGRTWTYDALFSGAGEATSATSVVYNAAAGLFFAAERYHGFYSSPDGLTWTRLATEPGAAGLLSTTACPQNYVTTCPIYRGEITVVPGRNEMYVWFVSLSSAGDPVDQGVWQSTNSGASWTQMSGSGILNCGDSDGCGVQQGFYNLELLAVPNGASATDLYAGAINLFKCSIN
ncbi:MAG: sialidase family protein, partial [Candidatus Sulfotelmatobacter sp.]